MLSGNPALDVLQAKWRNPAQLHRQRRPGVSLLRSNPYSPGIAGLFIAALFGAAMATLSSDLNCLALVAVEDFYRKLSPGATDQRRLRVAKYCVAVCGVLTAVFAIRLAHSRETALSLWYTISAIVAGGLAGLFLLAFLTDRANRYGCYIGIFASLVFTTWATLTLGGERSSISGNTIFLSTITPSAPSGTWCCWA